MNIEIRDAVLEARIQKQIQATGAGSVEEVLLRLLETQEEQDRWLLENREAINAKIRRGIDYPFFSELLPRSLFTRKIQLLITRLWGQEDQRFATFAPLSKRKQKRIFEQTTETPFADPERIIRATVTAPLWVIFPATTLFALYEGIGTSLTYNFLRQAYYLSVAAVLFLLF